MFHYPAFEPLGHKFLTFALVCSVFFVLRNIILNARLYEWVREEEKRQITVVFYGCRSDSTSAQQP